MARGAGLVGKEYTLSTKSTQTKGQKMTDIKCIDTSTKNNKQTKGKVDSKHDIFQWASGHYFFSSLGLVFHSLTLRLASPVLL